MKKEKTLEVGHILTIEELGNELYVALDDVSIYLFTELTNAKIYKGSIFVKLVDFINNHLGEKVFNSAIRLSNDSYYKVLVDTVDTEVSMKAIEAMNTALSNYSLQSIGLGMLADEEGLVVAQCLDLRYK